MAKDFLNLKKADDGLKKLDADLNKIFKSESEPKQSYKKQTRKSQEKLLQKSDIEKIKIIAKGTNDTIRKLYKIATKNQIPKNPDDIIAMKERLEEEESIKKKANAAIQIIKQIQQDRKRERNEKIKTFQRKLHLESFHYQGIKNKCCNNSTVKPYAGEWHQCNICKRLFKKK